MRCMNENVIYIASDHRGFPLKALFIDWLQSNGFTPRDLGPDQPSRCDASRYAVKLAAALKDDPNARGVLICGTGQAMAMTANRYQHIRAALCTNTTMARLAREHNNANVLALGAAITGDEAAFDCLKTFLTTAFLEGRYAERCQILTDLGGL